MFCKKCGEKTKVIETRQKPETNETLRYNVCKNPKCGHRFYSIETQLETTKEVIENWIEIGKRKNGKDKKRGGSCE